MSFVLGALILAWIGISVYIIYKKRLIGKCSGCDGNCAECVKTKLK